jgi:hypothetical protein
MSKTTGGVLEIFNMSSVGQENSGDNQATWESLEKTEKQGF